MVAELTKTVRCLRSVAFLHAGRVGPDRSWRMPLHSHARLSELIVVHAGQIETGIAGRTIIGKPGDVLVYPRGVAHVERAVGARPLETTFIAWSSTKDDLGNAWPLVGHDHTGRMRMLADWLLELGQGNLLDVPVTCHAVLRLLLSEFLTRGQTDGDSATSRVKAYVRKNLRGPLTLDDLAEVAGMSRFHFARQFRAEAGEAPMSFVRRSRVEAARALLLSTPLPLKAIAAGVGFPDEFQLSRVFKRVTGQPPSTVRRRG